MNRRWVQIAVVTVLVAVAAALLLWDADPVIRGELALRKAVQGDAATLPYPSRAFPGVTPRSPRQPAGRRLVIPAAGIDVAVIGARSADAGLLRGVWLDPAGSVPGSGEPVVIAGHRVRARFAPLHLVRVGDPVIAYWDGAEHDYRVTSIRTIRAEEGIDMQRDAPGDGERLVLYTCLPRWMGNKRTVVTAQPN